MCYGRVGRAIKDYPRMMLPSSSLPLLVKSLTIKAILAMTLLKLLLRKLTMTAIKNSWHQEHLNNSFKIGLNNY